MHRFIVKGNHHVGDVIDFPKEEAAHAVKVLRLHEDDEIEISNGEGQLFSAVMTAVSRDGAQARLEQALDDKEASVFLTLYMGYPKAEKLELIVQKLTELGAVRIVPVVMTRSVAKPGSGDAAKKKERLERIAVEAAKQCGRGRVPEIAEPMSWKNALSDMARRELMLIPWEDARGTRLGDIHAEKGDARDIALLIGPEGGIDASEVEQVTAQGGRTLTLGPRILRAETAAIAASAVVMALWGDV